MSRCYDKGITKINDHTIDYLGDTIVAILVDSTYAHDPTSNFVSAIVAHEVAGATRQPLAGKTVTQDDVNHRSVFDANDPTFPTVTSGSTFGGVIIARNTGADATSELIAFNSTAATPTNGSNITINFDPSGIFYGSI